MKQLIAAVICALFALTSAHAADKPETQKAAPAAKKEPSEAQKKQQDRMKDCNAKADGKSGDDRKKYMSSCLKGEESGKKEPSAAQKKQQDRMKDCNVKAEGKSGDDRKKYMSTCLKG
jgi:membrane-bound lytic murein transglycosylase